MHETSTVVTLHAQCLVQWELITTIIIWLLLDYFCTNPMFVRVGFSRGDFSCSGNSWLTSSDGYCDVFRQSNSHQAIFRQIWVVSHTQSYAKCFSFSDVITNCALSNCVNQACFLAINIIICTCMCSSFVMLVNELWLAQCLYDIVAGCHLCTSNCTVTLLYDFDESPQEFRLCVTLSDWAFSEPSLFNQLHIGSN